MRSSHVRQLALPARADRREAAAPRLLSLSFGDAAAFQWPRSPASVYSTAIWHQMMPGWASNDAPSHRARQRRFDPPC